MDLYGSTGQGRVNVDVTGKSKTTWQEHAECAWTWPSVYGVTGCTDHDEVFETPSATEAWLLDQLGGTVVGRAS